MGKPKNPNVPAKRDPAIVSVKAENETEHPAAIARASLRPEVQAAMTARAYTPFNKDDVVMDSLITELIKQCDAGHDGNLERGEKMLVAQAHTLDAIFGECARRARGNMGEYTQTAELYLRVGLRAQSQCRATWETLANIKNPAPVAFVRQANISAGPQQVNNGVSPPTSASRAEESESTPNKLIEAQNGQQMDTREASAPSRAHQDLEAVGAINRPANSGR